MLKRFQQVFTLFVFLFILGLSNVNAETFKYIYRTNDNYRILSIVDENVYINGKFNHTAEIVNRISVKITDTKGETGTHEATFITSEKNTTSNNSNSFSSQVHSWGREYLSIFDRNAQGVYTIDKQYFMPVVRDVPVFPNYDVKPGDTWSYDGHEAHDMREGFKIEEPFKIPFVANYKYLRDIEKDGKNLAELQVEYTLEYDSPVPNTKVVNYPKKTFGFSSQIILWDKENGLPYSYSENFRIVLNLASGDILEYIGSAKADVTERSLDRSKTEESLKEKIDELGIKDASVKIDEKGITISLSNIQFLPNSAVLQKSEKLKLDKIAEILKVYPNNDLLISGHTALAGTKKAQDELSIERASSVASYLIQKGVKDAQHVFSRGFGASQPVADNSTVEGMEKNRRVEITILD